MVRRSLFLLRWNLALGSKKPTDVRVAPFLEYGILSNPSLAWTAMQLFTRRILSGSRCTTVAGEDARKTLRAVVVCTRRTRKKGCAVLFRNTSWLAFG